MAGTPRVRRAFVLGGVAPKCDHVVHNSEHHNNLVGVIERVILAKGTEPPQPLPGLIPRTLSGVYDFFDRHAHVARPWNQDELLAHTRPHKMRVTVEAIKSLAISGVRRADSYIRGFVKAEKVFDKEAAPRVIQPRTPRYVVATSVFLKRLEGPIYSLLARLWGGPTVMKGFNAEQTAAHLREMWEQFDDPVAVGLDASRFDQHVSKQALQWEHSVYTLFYRGHDLRHLRELLSWQVNQRATFRAPDGKVKFKIAGGRASGDINTALGNCLLMCSMVYAYCAAHGIRARLANNGDDCVVIMDRKDLITFNREVNRFFLELGFTMKVEDPVTVFEKIVFCQTQPVWASEVWRMCRQFPQCLRKDTMFIDVRRDEVPGRVAAIGVCGTAVASGVPCLQALYERMAGVARPCGGESVGYGFNMMAHGLTSKHVDVTDEARLSFFAAFGVNPHQQKLFEAMELRLDDSPVVHPCPLWNV